MRADFGRRFVDGVALPWLGCTTSVLGTCNVFDCGLELEWLERRCVVEAELELRCHHGLWRSESGTRLGVSTSVIDTVRKDHHIRQFKFYSNLTIFDFILGVLMVQGASVQNTDLCQH